MSARRLGIVDVAQRAGVSVATVSQVLNGKRPVSEATRRRVVEVIEELGYAPHPGARSLRSRRTMSVALIVPDITNPFYPEVAVGIQHVMLAAGYQLSILNAAVGEESSVIRHVLDRRVDGMVVSEDGLRDADLAKIEESGTRVVVLGTDTAIEGADCIDTDDAGGVASMVAHLVGTGRRRLAFIGGEASTSTSLLRARGFADALAAHGLEVSADAIVHDSFSRQGGARGFAELYARDTRWDAIVCANDLIAIGALGAARERGIEVPRELAISGYDDIEAASLVSPSLTTVENPAREIGHTAARMLLERFDPDFASPPRRVALVNTLVVRESTAPTQREEEHAS